MNEDIAGQIGWLYYPEANRRTAPQEVGQKTPNAYGLYGYSMGGQSSELQEVALGSGVVLSDDGYILTNYHVVEGTEAIKVTIEGVEYDADVIEKLNSLGDKGKSTYIKELIRKEIARQNGEGAGASDKV